jgi:hypothetical protein
VRDVGIEPTSSRLKGECISISANPAILVGDAGIEPAWSRLRGECICHLCQFTHVQHQKWCRMLESNQRLAVIDRGLDLRANPAWCAVRELNPHLLGVGQLFWSVELPARKIGRGYRSRTCLAALIWRRSGYKPLLLPEALHWWLAMDSNHPRRLYESRVLPTELASHVFTSKIGWPGRIRTCAWRD